MGVLHELITRRAKCQLVKRIILLIRDLLRCAEPYRLLTAYHFIALIDLRTSLHLALFALLLVFVGLYKLTRTSLLISVSAVLIKATTF